MAAPANKKPGVQAKKSADTCNAILSATIDCVYKLGYASTSTKIVAETAQVSRGAMIHHFPTKHDLLVAAVEYLIDKRIDLFSKDIAKLKTEEQRNEHGMDIYWKHLKSKLFMVYHELTVAARTDKELAVVMTKGTHRFEKLWSDNIKALFPEWAETGAVFELAMDITQFTYEGMILNLLSHNDGKRRELIRSYIKARTRELLIAAKADKNSLAVEEFLTSKSKL